MVNAHGSLQAEVQLAERCGPQLAQALSGDVPYQTLLFPGGSMEAVRPIYEDTTLAVFYNGCVLAAVQAVLAALPAERRVVALEIGAGTGGTTSSVLPLLDGRDESNLGFRGVDAPRRDEWKSCGALGRSVHRCAAPEQQGRRRPWFCLV